MKSLLSACRLPCCCSASPPGRIAGAGRSGGNESLHPATRTKVGGAANTACRKKVCPVQPEAGGKVQSRGRLVPEARLPRLAVLHLPSGKRSEIRQTVRRKNRQATADTWFVNAAIIPRIFSR